jgi:hypothetical protein
MMTMMTAQCSYHRFDPTRKAFTQIREQRVNPSSFQLLTVDASIKRERSALCDSREATKFVTQFPLPHIMLVSFSCAHKKKLCTLVERRHTKCVEQLYLPSTHHHTPILPGSPSHPQALTSVHLRCFCLRAKSIPVSAFIISSVIENSDPQPSFGPRD